MNQTHSTEHRDSILYALALVLCCVALNLIGSRLASALGLPLFLDCAGSIIAAVLGGYLPGIVTGYLTNLLSSLGGNPINAYYATLNVLIALCSSLFAQHGYFRNRWKPLLCIPVFAMIGGALGSVITWFLYSMSFGEGISAPLAHFIYERFGMSAFSSQLIADIAYDLPDKAIVLTISMLVMRILPDELTDEFMQDIVIAAPLHDVGKIKISDTLLNKPGKLTDEEFTEMKKHTTYGSEVLSSAIALVPESGYLDEAKDLAEFHHERWDGKGIPAGSRATRPRSPRASWRWRTCSTRWSPAAATRNRSPLIRRWISSRKSPAPISTRSLWTPSCTPRTRSAPSRFKTPNDRVCRIVRFSVDPAASAVINEPLRYKELLSDETERTEARPFRPDRGRRRRGRFAPAFFGHGRYPRRRGHRDQAGAHGRPDGAAHPRL